MDFWTAIIAGVIALIIYIYFFFGKKKNYFQEHDIPHISPLPIVGNLGFPFLQNQSVLEIMQNIYNINKDAKYVGIFDFSSPTVMIRDPELIKSITIKNFDHFVNHRSFVDPEIEPMFGNNLFSLHDDKWREVRVLLTPAFTSSKMKGMFKLMLNCAESFADYLVEQSQVKLLEINSKDAFCRYTTDVIATCAFGISVNSMKDRNNEFYVLGKIATSFEGFLIKFKFILMRGFPALARLLKVRFIDSRVERFFKNVVQNTIRVRDEKGITRPDLIQLMMETRNNKTGPQFSIEEMVSHAFIFFFGGFETASSLMCFAAHHVAADPEVQEKLQNEVDEMMEKCNGDITYEAVNGLQYLDAVINESLRLFPIMPFIDRLCTKSFELPPTLPGKAPLRLSPGDYIWIPIYPLHRDSKYFSDPDAFKPDRFIDDPKGSLNSPAYLPFGIGPRMCIGNRFALLETKVLLVHLIAKFKLKPAKKMIIPLKLVHMGVMPEGGFWLDLESRNKWTARSNG